MCFTTFQCTQTGFLRNCDRVKMVKEMTGCIAIVAYMRLPMALAIRLSVG
jgi:hypothetical protein